MSSGAASAAEILEAAPDAVSLWFAFGGDPDSPTLVLGDRTTDPRGQEFLPQAKALAKAGSTTQGVASRKGGGAFTVLSRVAFAGLVEQVASWTVAHVAEHRGLLELKDLRYVQVDAENKPVDQQSDPLAWGAVDEAVAAADAEPAVELDDRARASCAVLASGAESCWFWLSVVPEGGLATLVLIDRAGDPKGAGFAAAIKAAIADGVPNPGSVRGLLNIKPNAAPMGVGRSGYAGFVDAMVAWVAACSQLDGAERLREVGYTQLDAANQLVERQVDPGAWAAAARAEAEAAGEVVHDESEADKIAALVEAAEPDQQMWYWLGRGEAGVELVMRSVERDPGRSDFDRGVLHARERLGGDDDLEQTVGRARKLANGTLVYKSLAESSGFTASLKEWVVRESPEAPGLAAIVGARFQYVSEQGNVFQDQPWPAAGKRSDRSRKAHSEPAAAPAPAPASTAAELPTAEGLPAARRALDGTRVDLDASRDAVLDTIDDAAEAPTARQVQDLAEAVDTLAQQVDSWLEQRADFDDARAETRALRRAAWGDAPGGDADLPALDGDPDDAAEDARDLGGAMIDTEEATLAWRDAAKGPPFSARNPLELPDLSVPAGLRALCESIDALEAALDAACATATPPPGAEGLASADEDAAAAREVVLPALLDLSADAIAAAEGLSKAAVKLEQHSASRRAFPESLREKFDTRLGEAAAALTQLGGTLLWLTRPADRA